MPEEQDNQIERREPVGINRMSENARRGSAAARFVGGLANRHTKSRLANTVSAAQIYEFSLKWGTEGTGDGQFNRPDSVPSASDCSVYVTDTWNHRIQKFTSEGEFVTKWGTKGRADGQFEGPEGIAVAPDGSIYVSNSGNRRIQKFTSEGVFISKWGTEGTGDGQFTNPRGVAVASDGSVYVADLYNYRIQKFSVGP